MPPGAPCADAAVAPPLASPGPSPPRLPPRRLLAPPAAQTPRAARNLAERVAKLLGRVVVDDGVDAGVEVGAAEPDDADDLPREMQRGPTRITNKAFISYNHIHVLPNIRVCEY